MSGIAVMAAIQILTLSSTLLMTFWSLKRRRLYGFLFAGLSVLAGMFLFSLPSLTAEFGYRAVSDSVVIGLAGSLCLIVAVVTVEVAAGKSCADQFRNPISEARLIWPAYLAMMGACVLLTLAIAARRGSSLAIVNWEDFRADTDFLDSLASLLQFVLFPAAWVAFRSGRRITAAILLLVALVSFPVFGSRAALLALPAAIAIDVLRSRLTRARKYLVIGIVASGGLLLHVLGRIVRGLGIGGIYQMFTSQSATKQVLEEVSESVDWTGGESEILRYFVYSVDKSDFDGAAVLASVTRWFSMYVPRWLAPDTKPEDVTYVLWRHATNDGLFETYPSIERLLELLRAGDSGSIHPTLWGEMWVNGGWLAIPVVAIGLAVIVVAIERIYDVAPRLVAVLVAPATVVGYLMVARGNSVIGLGYTFYLLPIAFAMYLVAAGASTAIWGSRNLSTASNSGRSGLAPSVDNG